MNRLKSFRSANSVTGRYNFRPIVIIGVALSFMLTTCTKEPEDSFEKLKIVWNKNFGGSEVDVFYSVAAVSDGTVAVGYSEHSSFGGGDWAGVTGKGLRDAAIVKYDHNGNLAWKKNFGGSDNDYFHSVTAVPGGVAAVGYLSSDSYFAQPTDDAYAVKFDNSGNIVWEKKFGGKGNSADYFQAVTAVSDGIVVVGYSGVWSFGTGDWQGVEKKSSKTGGVADYDATIVKFDNNGNVVWKDSFGGDADDRFVAVTAVADGVVAAGYSKAGSFKTGSFKNTEGKGDEDAFIVKYSNSGAVMWIKNFGGKDDDGFHSIIALPDGLVAAGYAYSDSFGNGDWADVAAATPTRPVIVKFDNSGNVVWKKNFLGYTHELKALTPVTGGFVTTFSVQNESDVCAIKFDAGGNEQWNTRLGGAGHETIVAMTVVDDCFVAVGVARDGAFNTGIWKGIQGKGSADAIIIKFKN